jgi:hypothetical protein
MIMRSQHMRFLFLLLILLFSLSGDVSAQFAIFQLNKGNATTGFLLDGTGGYLLDGTSGKLRDQ